MSNPRWKAAEREQSGNEYCWRNFLSFQTLRAIDSLRKQFYHLLKESRLIANDRDSCNTWSHDDHLVRAIICAGLFPGVCSVMNKEKSITLKTMEDGPVLLHSNSVNGQEMKIPFPWLVFNEKMKVNAVFLRDSTAVSDSSLLLFGGNISEGGLDGHLKMLGGYLEFFMKPSLAKTYLCLKSELNELIQNKLLNPELEIQNHEDILSAVRMMITEDSCEGRFVFGRKLPSPSKKASKNVVRLPGETGDDNSKGQLQTLLLRAGHEAPVYKTRQVKNNQYRAIVIFNSLEFVGQPCNNKKQAEKEAASEAIRWLMGETPSFQGDINHMSMLLKKSKKKQGKRA